MENNNENNIETIDVDSNQESESNNVEILDIESDINQQINIQEEEINNINNVITNDNYEEPEEKKKSSKLIIVLLLLVLIIGGGFAYFKLMLNPLKVYKTVIDNVSSESIKAKNKVYSDNSILTNSTNKIFEAKGDLSFTVDIPKDMEEDFSILEGLAKLKFDLDTVADLKNNNISTGFAISENGKKIISLDLFNKDNKMFINSNLFSNPYYIIGEDTEQIFKSASATFNITSKDIDTLIEKTCKYISESIDAKYLTQKMGSFTVNKESIFGLNNILTLDSKNGNEILDKISKSILNDDEYISIVSKLISGDKSKPKEIIKSSFDEMKNEIKTKPFIINVYVDFFGKLKAVEFTQDKNKVNYITSSGKFSLSTENNKVDGTIKDNKIDLNFDDGVSKSSLIVNIKSESNVVLNYKGEDFEFNIDWLQKLENKEEKNTINGEIIYNDNGSKLKIGFKSNLTGKEVTSIKSFDTSKAKPVEKLSDDLMNILTKLETNTKGTVLEDIVSLLTMFGTDI